MFSNYLQVILSLHQDTTLPLDWLSLLAAPEPVLEHEAGRVRDAEAYERKRVEWAWYLAIARRVMTGDLQAHADVIRWALPFEELEELGIEVSTRPHAASCMEGFAVLRDSELIPTVEPRWHAGGTFTWQRMAKGRYWNLYREHVCSAAVRIARELFALLPVETVLVHAAFPAPESGSDRAEPLPILSVRFVRRAFLELDFERLSPPLAVLSCRHRLAFETGRGFAPIEQLSCSMVFE